MKQQTSFEKLAARKMFEVVEYNIFYIKNHVSFNVRITMVVFSVQKKFRLKSDFGEFFSVEINNIDIPCGAIYFASHRDELDKSQLRINGEKKCKLRRKISNYFDSFLFVNVNGPIIQSNLKFRQ